MPAIIRLQKAFDYYLTHGGETIVTFECFLYLVTRKGMNQYFREIMRGKVSIKEFDNSVLFLLLFGDDAAYFGIKGFENLEIPQDVEKAIDFGKNNAYKGVKKNGR